MSGPDLTKTPATAPAVPAPTGEGGGALLLRGVGMDFHAGRRRPAGAPAIPTLVGVDLAVAPGEFVCIVGASGSGKSTLLRLVAGLIRPTEGQVTLDGRPVEGPGPERGLVCQSGALFPWRTAAANIAFGLELLPMPRAERRRRVAWYLNEVGLEAYGDRLPGQLSGGQRQRVAIARALACEPRVVLLDEPFGALDVQTKEDMQLFLRQVWADTGTTVLMVTHDVEEAVFLGQRVVVLASDPGRVVADLPVRLPAGRDLGTRRDPAFLELRAEVEDLVRLHHRAHTSRLAATAG
ncbi:ABC transporter ATP-binding protein [Frankia sp. CN6]|uniref:ABC transporter ATP-binding protein n=2 Tax=Frankia nepalensis TaxID=1836974 RepID=A0A937RET7_9ACTN|nr:ABC transporter ATP-binding protein [Frankia nepalensis]MBL7628912.1 ABC transporter ATP-binding protein [Frankia nepalensis]